LEGNPSIAAAGGVIRDHNSFLIEGYAKNLGFCTSNVMEASAAWWGIRGMKEMGFDQVVIGDLKLIIDILKGVFAVPWAIRDMVEDLKRLIEGFS
jgi:ribonuclease HI